MSPSIRAVPVLKLRQSRDARLTNSQWLSDQRVLRELLTTRMSDEGVVIPLAYERRSSDLLIQERLRIVDGSATPSNPTFVIFRRQSGELTALSLTPALSLAGVTADYVGSDDAPRTGEWLYWSVRWDRENLGTWYSTPPRWRSAYANPKPRSEDYPAIEAIFIGSALADHMIAELRLWEAHHPVSRGWTSADQYTMDRRLDGREPALIGYWKFNEGNGTRITDASKFGHHGTLNGGQWVAAKDSGLSLDCALEDAQTARKNVITLKSKNQELGQTLVALKQQGDRLDSSIQHLKEDKQKFAEALRPRLEAVEKQLREENDRHDAWQRDIADRGKVSLDKFSEDTAREIDEVIGRLDAKNSAYRLDGVGLEVKMLPVQADDKSGSQDYRVIFPGADDPIDAQQLSTVRFDFEARPKKEKLDSVAVPDVRGYTELAARRKLRDTGFTARVMDQATDDGREVGRVVSQIVEEIGEKGRVVTQVLGSDIKVTPNSIVTIFLGRAGRESSGGGAVPEATGQR